MNDFNNKNFLYDFLRDYIGVSEDALDLAFGLIGFTKETAEDILWYQTGYNDFEQWVEDNPIY